MGKNSKIIDSKDLILITGSSGFIGTRVVAALLEYGFRNLRCLVRPSSSLSELNSIAGKKYKGCINIAEGNLLSKDDCFELTKGVKVIYHLAAGRGDKSPASAFLNSAVTTRNLIKGASKNKELKRLVNISSFAVYSNAKIKRGGLLDENSPTEINPEKRGEAYCFAKVNQEKIVSEYCRKYSIPYVTIRPGVVYGPGNKGIHGRIGIGTFGIFLHLGGLNKIPLSYVDNCADAIVRAGFVGGIDYEIFNVVDDDLPTSIEFLKLYKSNVKNFKSIYIPYKLFYILCSIWEKYSKWSERQLPPAFNRNICSTYWKGNSYSNDKIKKMLGWEQKVAFKDAMRKYYDYQIAVGGKK